MPSKAVKFSPEKPAPEKRSHGLGITIFSAAILVVIVVHRLSFRRRMGFGIHAVPNDDQPRQHCAVFLRWLLR